MKPLNRNRTRASKVRIQNTTDTSLWWLLILENIVRKHVWDWSVLWDLVFISNCPKWESFSLCFPNLILRFAVPCEGSPGNGYSARNSFAVPWNGTAGSEAGCWEFLSASISLPTIGERLSVVENEVSSSFIISSFSISANKSSLISVSCILRKVPGLTCMNGKMWKEKNGRKIQPFGDWKMLSD